MPNRLANETSPYLLQHKDNPVDWYPWGPEALGRATSEDKPILVSIGYSACHWCHVMEHESFSDSGTARMMNDRFVCIKVDREERPDIDHIYMSAVQAMSGHGGWPLNVFLTPEGVPFFGGTYWPPYDARGMPGFRRVLEAVSETFTDRRDDVNENASRLRDVLQRMSAATPDPAAIGPETLDAAVSGLSQQFDSAHGGFGGAPKFPQPMLLDFLLRQHHRTGSDEAGRMVRETLDRMAAGGMYDQIGGGFHRYSVDAVWLVPHFEKMLYDNAQLARIYLDAARAFDHEPYRRVAGETLDYVIREMTSPEGGFYSAQDADSEGEEGRFYVWTPAQIDAVLGPEDGATVRQFFGVTDRGNFEGRSILHRPVGEAPDACTDEILDRARPQLLASRGDRVWPGRDDKVITGWNGMMLRAMAEGGKVLGRADLLDAARLNGEFLLTRAMRDGRLARTWKDGVAKGEGFLEDYAHAADGLLALYQATFERRWLDGVMRLIDQSLDLFDDGTGGMLFDTGAHHEQLVVRPRELQDGATPSGNSVMAGVLVGVAALTGREAYRERAAGILRSLAQPMAEIPTGFGRALVAADAYLATPREITFAGDLGSPDFDELVRTVWTRYDPNAVLAWADSSDHTLAELLPIVKDRPIREGRAAAYVCERFTCLPPVSDPPSLIAALDRQIGGSRDGGA